MDSHALRATIEVLKPRYQIRITVSTVKPPFDNSGDQELA